MDRVQLIETAPLGSELDDRTIPNAIDFIPEIIASAESTLDIAQMYMLYYPPESKGSLLYRLYDAITAAAARGVRVRIMLDSTVLAANPTATYCRMREQLARFPGITVRAVDLRPFSRYPECLMHAKYLVVDRRTLVMGSHNWSFGGMADNRELSLVIEDSSLVTQVLQVFERDWNYENSQTAAVQIPSRNRKPSETGQNARELRLAVAGPVELALPQLWQITDAFASVVTEAESTLDIEVNSISPRIDFGDDIRFTLVESLLQSAAARGVRIRLLVDRWAYLHEPFFIRALDSVPGIDVRVIDITRIGPNPGAGTLHAKFVLADRRRLLLGSATLSHRQLTECRNLAVLSDDSTIARQLIDLFERDWFSVLTRQP
ncbi:MAG: phospholipase D-like domain-containing protein [candidate division WOR-3 bacterium]